MTASAPSPPVRPRGAGPLRRRDVRLLLAGQAASELGSQVGSIALTNLLWAAAGTVQLLFLVHQVGLAPAAIGPLVSAGAAGGLLAALAATRVAGVPTPPG